MTGTCRECRQKTRHKLGCSRRRYGAKIVPDDTDTVAAPHEPETHYCPGVEVACYYGEPDEPGTCRYTGTDCYYREGVTE